jgi:excisionase family DNA binding protein
MDEDERPRMWLTTHEVASQLRIPEPTIRKHCRKGLFPGAVRIGKTWRISADYAGKLVAA